MKVNKKFISNEIEIPSYSVGINDWITIIFPSDCLSDEKIITQKYVKSILDQDVLDVRPWNKLNLPFNKNYDDGVIDLIQNSKQKNYILFGPVSDHGKYYKYFDSNNRNFGIVEFFHPCSEDVQIDRNRIVIDLSKNKLYNEFRHVINKSQF